MSHPLLEFHDAAFGYRGKPVVSGLRFAVHVGEFVGLVGPNGSGKTTLLRGVLGLLEPLQGKVVRHERLSGGAVHMGYVPQRETLDESFPLSVSKVVSMGRYRRMGRRRGLDPEDHQAVRKALEAVGLQDRQQAPFRTLSGGQKQRTLIARALAAEPDLLVLDEPTSGMDLGSEQSVMELVSRIHHERHLTVLMVSHQLNTVARWVKHMGLVHDGHVDFGTRDEILTGEHLSEVYGAGTRVVDVEGHPMVLPPGGAR